MNAKPNKQERAVVEIRAKAFAGEGVRTYRVMVDPDTVLPLTGAIVQGLVRVYDPVAGYFTTCHELSPRAKAAARAKAKRDCDDTRED